MKITTDKVKYEVYSLYPTRKNTAEFSCEKDCFRCPKKCDIGLINYEIHYQDIGA